MGGALVSRILPINGEDRRTQLYCEINFRCPSQTADLVEQEPSFRSGSLRLEHASVEAIDCINNLPLI